MDLAATAPSLVTNRDSDVLFGGPTPMNGEALVSMLLPAGIDRKDPLVSPLYADLSKLPPAYVQAGGAEMLLDDARRFAERARAAGVKVELDVFEDQQHTFQMMAGRAPEADEANDADAYVTAYADTASCVMPGAYLPDRAALHTAMRQLFAGPLAGARGTYEVRSIRYLGSEVAVVISRGVVLLANQTDPAEAEPWMDTWVLSREGDSWRVASFHSCPEQA